MGPKKKFASGVRHCSGPRCPRKRNASHGALSTESVPFYRMAPFLGIPRKRSAFLYKAQIPKKHGTYICIEYFISDAFELDSAIVAKFGMNKRKTLKPGAVSTIFIRNSSATNHAVHEIRSWKRTVTAPGRSEIESLSNVKRKRSFRKDRNIQVLFLLRI